MANIEEAIRRLKYLYEVHGADQVASAQAAITASTTTTERAALSLEKSFNSLERKYVSTVRHQQDYQKELAKANDALKQGVTSQERYDVVLQNMNQHYANAARGLNTYGKALDQSTQQGRLARHELINLSRQFQDVGVSLASGQAPLTVVVQQGAQIADVFASSTGTLAGFFRQVSAGAGRFITSTAGIVTGVTAIGGAIGFAAADYASGQRDIERALSGIGRASGVTRDQINAIGQTSKSAFGLSASEAREAATAFAGTGKIYGENVGQATKAIDAFMRGGGNAAEGTKKLAAAMLDPAKGVLELNKGLGFLDATTLNYIRSLQAQGDLQGAQAATLKAYTAGLEEQAKHVGFLTREWNKAINTVSKYYEIISGGAARDIERATGADLGGFSQAEQLARAQERLSQMEASPFQWSPVVKAALEEARAEVERLQKAMADLKAEADKKALNTLSTEADAAARAIMPAIAQIETLTEQLSKLRQHREQTGGPVTGAEQVGAVRVAELQQQEAATVRVAQATAQIAALYPGMSMEVAKQLYTSQQQLAVAQARNPAEAMVAQEIATQNQLLLQGKTIEEAMAMAAAQRAITQAQLNVAHQNAMLGLQQQLLTAQAVTVEEKNAALYANTYAAAIQAGYSAAQARAQAVAATAVAEAQLEATIRAAAQSSAQSLQFRNAELQAELGLLNKSGIEVNRLKAEWDALAPIRQAALAAGKDEAEVNAILAEQQGLLAGLIEQNAQLQTARELAAEAEKDLAATQKAQAEDRIDREKAWADMLAEDQRRREQEAKDQEQAEERAYRARMQRIEAERQAEARAAEERARARAEQAAYDRAMAFVPKLAAYLTPGGASGLFKSPQGGYSQWDPDNPWIIEMMVPMATSLAEAIKKYGPGGIETVGEGNLAQFVGPTVQGVEYLINQTLGSGGTIEAAITQALGEGAPGQQVAQQLLNLIPEAQQKTTLQQMIAQLANEPRTLARETLLKQLNDQLKGLTNSVDALNGTLSPFYSQDPRTTRLGFRAGVMGNPDWMTGATNQTALDTILGKGATAPGGITIDASGGVTVTAPGSTVPITGTVVTPPYGTFPVTSPGITGSQITPLTEAQRQQRAITGINNLSATGFASGGSFVVGGGYSATDNRMAQFPVASGEQVVVNRRPQDARPVVVHNDNRIIIQGSVDQDTLSKLKISRYQQTQRMRGAIAAA